MVQVELLAQTLVQAVCRTRQQGALAVANARARRIAAYIPDGLLLLSIKGNVSWVSPSFCAMSGLAERRILNRMASSFFHPSHRQALEEQMARAVRRVTTPRSPCNCKVESGDWRWADVCAASGRRARLRRAQRGRHERPRRSTSVTSGSSTWSARPTSIP